MWLANNGNKKKNKIKKDTCIRFLRVWVPFWCSVRSARKKSGAWLLRTLPNMAKVVWHNISSKWVDLRIDIQNFQQIYCLRNDSIYFWCWVVLKNLDKRDVYIAINSAKVLY